jgi:hypothetical protein
VRFLDPFTKSNVFLREITSRLTLGLAQDIPDLQERVNHILTKQVFGIGITRLTSLLARRSVYDYSKYANGAHPVATSFASDAGNIWFERTEHTWTHGKCSFCGTSLAAMDRGKALATGEFIEEQIFNWTYTDEQRAKAAFAAVHPANRSPYVALPQMRLLTNHFAQCGVCAADLDSLAERIDGALNAQEAKLCKIG